MGKDIKCTILLVTYNHVKYIERAIKSLLMQETNFKFKIFIAEDCSTDGTKEICRKYAKDYPDIIEHIDREINVGVLKNAEPVIKNIKSPYWTALDGDDYWCDKYRLQMCIDALDKNEDCSIAAHSCTQFFSEENNKNIIPDKRARDSINGRITWENEMQYIKKNRAFRLPASSALVYRTNVVDLKNISSKYYGHLPMYLLHLEKKDCIYIDKVMSVYNCANPNSVAYGWVNRSEANRIREEINFIYLAWTLCRMFPHSRASFAKLIGKPWYFSWKKFLVSKKNNNLSLNLKSGKIEVYTRDGKKFGFIFVNWLCLIFGIEKPFEFYSACGYLLLKKRPSNFKRGIRIDVEQYDLRHSFVNNISKLAVGFKIFKRVD